MSNDIILDKFNEWTNGKNETEARIAIYNQIRDIPYAIIPELRDPTEGPSGLLKMCQGSCVPKHFLLGMLFEKLGIKIKYATYLFSWDDPEVKYPPELRKIVKTLPTGTHLACKAYINNRWILVDATFDIKLKRAGFPVTNKWDGISNTKNAVKYTREVVHETIEDRVKFAAEQRKSWTDEQVKAYEKFPAVFNAWLVSLRKA